MAQDIFWESPCIPPVKIVEQGTMRRDIEEYYLRSSRVPKLVALDLRAEITGCTIARERIVALIERYGAGTVKATMRKLQDDSEAAFVRRLESIPDGTWTEEGWLEVSLPGDRGLYRNRVTLTKRGDTLDLLERGLGAAGGDAERRARGLEGRRRLDARLADALRPDVRDRGRAAALRVRRRAGADQLRHAARPPSPARPR